MAGKSKKKGKKFRRYLPLLLVAGGAAIVIFGQRWFDNVTDKFVNGIGYKFRNLKLKFRNVTTLQVTAVMTITNTNAIGGKVNSFTGEIRYGQNGPKIVPVNVAAFNLPANGSVDANIISEVNVFQLAASAQDVVKAIAAGNLKKLWLRGKLDTTFAQIPIDTEISPLEA